MSQAANQGVLVACIGNIFLGDDGFGVEAARALCAAPLPPHVRVVDFGIRGLDLAYALLDPWQAVVLVDVIARGGAPGTLYLLQASGPEADDQPGLDPHSMDPLRVLVMARSLGDITAEVFIVGCEPLDFGEELEGRMGLSPPVAEAVPAVVPFVLDLLERMKENATEVCAAQ